MAVVDSVDEILNGELRCTWCLGRVVPEVEVRRVCECQPGLASVEVNDFAWYLLGAVT